VKQRLYLVRKNEKKTDNLFDDYVQIPSCRSEAPPEFFDRVGRFEATVDDILELSEECRVEMGFPEECMSSNSDANTLLKMFSENVATWRNLISNGPSFSFNQAASQKEHVAALSGSCREALHAREVRRREDLKAQDSPLSAGHGHESSGETDLALEMYPDAQPEEWKRVKWIDPTQGSKTHYVPLRVYPPTNPWKQAMVFCVENSIAAQACLNLANRLMSAQRGCADAGDVASTPD
jgi:hypothetical protein